MNEVFDLRWLIYNLKMGKSLNETTLKNITFFLVRSIDVEEEKLSPFS